MQQVWQLLGEAAEENHYIVTAVSRTDAGRPNERAHLNDHLADCEMCSAPMLLSRFESRVPEGRFHHIYISLLLQSSQFCPKHKIQRSYACIMLLEYFCHDYIGRKPRTHAASLLGPASLPVHR